MQAALKYVPFPIRFFKHRHTTLNSDVMRISASPLHLKTVTSQERKKNIWVPNVDSSELVCIYPDKKKPTVFPQKRSMKPILLITFVLIGLNMHSKVCAVALLD